MQSYLACAAVAVSCTGFLCGSALCLRLRLSSISPCPATPQVTWPATISSLPMPNNCILPTLEHSLVGRAAVLDIGPLLSQATSLEHYATQSQTMWAGIQPVQAITEDIFIWTVRPWHGAV